MTTLRHLPLSKVDRNAEQPRKRFDQDALQELAASIAEHGLLEPVIVRPVGHRFLLVAGERRWRASHIAGVAKIPAIVHDDLDDAAAYVLSVVENVNRADMTVLEEAAAYQQMVDHGRTVTEVAGLLGKRPSDVDDRIRLLNLEPHIRDMVDAGHMGPYLAWYVCRLKPGNQRVVAQRLARGELDQTEGAEFAKALMQAEEEVGFFDMEEPTEEERIEHQKRARQVQSQAQQVERLSGLMGEFAAADPVDLAASLGNDVDARLRSMERIARQAQAAVLTLRKAKAVAEARTMAVKA